MSDLTHFDEEGASRMVNVGQKPTTHRLAKAEAIVSMQSKTREMIADKEFVKGDVLEVARLAGIMAVKRTADLIPLCHSLAVDGVVIDFQLPDNEATVQVVATVEVHAKTGVEMEALVAASTAALTIYDMCKAVDRGMSIHSLRLVEKRGGKSGHYVREQS